MIESGVSTKVRIFARLCNLFGVTRLFTYLNRDRKRILTYHSVLPDVLYSSERLLDGVSHSETVVAAQMKWIAEHYQVTTDFEDAKSVTITFDDGFQNQANAIQRYMDLLGIKAVFFCVCDLVRNNRLPIIDKILLWFDYIPKGIYCLALGAKQEIFSISDSISRHSAWQMAYKGVLTRHWTINEFYDCLNHVYPYDQLVDSIDSNYLNIRLLPVTETQLEELRNCGHLIGAHSVSHGVMSVMEDEELVSEMRACYDAVGLLYNTYVFSYPFGGPSEVDERCIRECASAGFESAVSNVNWNSSTSLPFSRHFLPRMMLPNTINTEILVFILSGCHYFLKYWRRLPK